MTGASHGGNGHGRDWVIALLAPAVLLLPFLNKAFHMDDPLFLWLGRHIQEDPVRFFDFDVHWHLTPLPMHEVTMNPPGTGYFIAVVASFAGWGEYALHMAFLFPAVAVGGGTYYLARQCCRRPVLATVVAIVTPAFLVSSGSVMSDTMMLAVYVWAVGLWMRGMTAGRGGLLATSALLLGVGVLIKYLVITAVPLLAVYALALERRWDSRILWLVLPCGVLAGYHFLTLHLFGTSMVLGASAFSTEHAVDAAAVDFMKPAMALAFLGGSMAPVLFLTPFVWSRRGVAAWCGAAVVIGLSIILLGRFGHRLVHGPDGAFRWGFLLQAAIWTTAGLQLLALAGRDLYRHRDAAALLLFLWIIGMAVFAGWINWTINARTILALIPAAAIVLARSLSEGPAVRRGYLPVAVTCAAGLGMAVAWGDYRLAAAQREAAAEIASRMEGIEAPVYFQGHWGFQHYMERQGFLPFNAEEGLRAGEVVVIPANNVSTLALPGEIARPVLTLEAVSSRWVTTMHRDHGAGFHAHFWGPLPFVFGRIEPERYGFYEVTLPSMPEEDGAEPE